MRIKRLWWFGVLTALVLLMGWCCCSTRSSVDAQAGDDDHLVLLPLIMRRATPAPPPTPVPTPVPTPAPPVPYGVSYIGESDLPEIVALNVKLVSWQTNPSPEDALALLDLAESHGLRVILRIGGSEDWGWNGSRFYLSDLSDYEPVIGGHPALFAAYGLHEPWERFTVGQLQRFYSQWHAMAPSIPLWHDLGYISPGFTDGICDVCGVSADPHAWDQSGEPINEYETRTRDKVSEAQTRLLADPDAILCVSLQTYGRNPESPGPPVRMPTADEMRENASIVFGELEVTCGLWYPYRHSSYEYVLSSPEFDEQRQVVAETYDLYFAP